MIKSRVTSISAMLLTISIVLSLTGCGANTTITTTGDETAASSQQTTEKPNSTIESPDDETSESSTESEKATVPTDEPSEPTVVTPLEEEKDEYGLTEKQRNSFSMLYYLAITAEEIRTSKDNRLMLDEIYTSLLNDINPSAIDETTQKRLKSLRDTIKECINISIKRERLQYIYNQKKAETIRSAIPNPLAILSAAQSFNWRGFVLSTAFTVVDSYNSYKSANDTADQEFLLSGWELDDKERDAILKNRERAFDYMVDIVQEYGLDGKLTLNERAIETFAEICAIESTQQKIRRLESEKETYKLLGNYWLELAACYFETEQYQKCLDCVTKYNDLSTGIFRMDYNYVKVIPMAIVAAQEIYTGDEYVSVISAFADSILENTATEEWSVRYIAAQVYLDLYAKTGNRQYMESAYNIAYDNVTILLDEQRALNSTYLADVEKPTIKEPEYRFMTDNEEKEAKQKYKAEQKQLEKYYEGLKEIRKKELPPLYEPLVLNCDLLFALAKEMNISSTEKTEIEDILQSERNGVFLSDPINVRYSFFVGANDSSIEFAKNEIKIPANLLSTGAEIMVKVTDRGKTTTFDDCTVSKVERDGDGVETFVAIVTSKKIKDYQWTADSKVVVEIYNGTGYEPSVFKFIVVEYKDYLLIPDKVVFEKE